MIPVTSDDASESPLGAILAVAITVVLAMLVLLMVSQLPNLLYDRTVPTIFEITKIRHTDKDGVLDYDSYMVVKNNGKKPYDNRKLYAKTYRNGDHLPCDIPTMNGHDFIPLHPYGIKTLGGFGSDNFLWYPDATIAIDYSDGTFHPGDIVQFDVYDRTTDQVISRDTYPHTDGNQEKLMQLYFSYQGA
ncbi:type IV pilin [Methanoregula sp.]|uniref:type IV pilin n=1 Tax=Methanoregula sp. TaxID=2052170 RepID=UPI003C729B1B